MKAPPLLTRAVRQAMADNLTPAQQVVTRVEARRQRDMRASVATLAENPTLKAALDTWVTERASANEQTSQELLATVQREADKIAGIEHGRALGPFPRNEPRPLVEGSG